VPAAGVVLALLLSSACVRPTERGPQTRLPPAARIVAIGDLHGDLEATRRALRLAGAIDLEDRWIGADLVLVQIGDQLDRGDEERAVLDLLEKLVHEARAAGGAVHLLNGNHELMNVEGDMRYVTPGGFADFLDVDGVDLNDESLSDIPLDQRARYAAFAPGGPYARLLARRNVVTVIGDNVFVHAGLLPHVVAYGLDRLNSETRQWVLGERPDPPAILLPHDGPVWDRHYSDQPDASDCALLEQALAMIGGKRMIVGHTIQEEGITPACGGRVWCIDVGMSSGCEGAPPAVLEIVGDRVRPITAEPAVDSPAVEELPKAS
jgi:hypothetical protein